MFGKKVHLFTLFGFKVNVDFSWLILALLITWTLSTSLFPHYFKGFSTATYWWMGIAGALGLFASIIFHEFCHSIVARHFGLPMKGITLFIFGGVAEMKQEPDNPKSEFFMAIAGPLSSAFFAGLLYSLSVLGTNLAWHKALTNVLRYLVWLNLLLAIFNLVPAFPLDGGRVLRSALWAVKGNLRWATRVASSFGSAFGMFLIIMGIIAIVTQGNFVAGLWQCLIGLFIRKASQMSYRQLLIRRALAGEPVHRFMETNPVVVPASVSIEQLIYDYFYRYHYDMFPVSDGRQLIGSVTTKDVKKIPRQQWDTSTVDQIADPCSDKNTISPDTDATHVLAAMNSTGNTRMLVVQNGSLAGIITLKDLLKYLSMKIDFEDNEKVRFPGV